MYVVANAFFLPKPGCDPSELEDSAAFRERPVRSAARLAAADGATSSYRSQLWAQLLVAGFCSDADLVLESSQSTSDWVRRSQAEWRAVIPRAGSDLFDSWYEEDASENGSFATFRGVEVSGIGDSRAPLQWTSWGVGDVVLFHISDGRLVDHSPRLSSGDFDDLPSGLSTFGDVEPAATDRLTGLLDLGDALLLCTDALAHWLTLQHEERRAPWADLAAASPLGFSAMIERARQESSIRADDILLLRGTAVASLPTSFATDP